MLEIINVSKTFNKGTVNEKKALDRLCLKIEEGDFITVIGGNGAGKSTMLNMIAGVYPIDSGAAPRCAPPSAPSPRNRAAASADGRR